MRLTFVSGTGDQEENSWELYDLDKGVRRRSTEMDELSHASSIKRRRQRLLAHACATAFTTVLALATLSSLIIFFAAAHEGLLALISGLLLVLFIGLVLVSVRTTSSASEQHIVSRALRRDTTRQSPDYAPLD